MPRKKKDYPKVKTKKEAEDLLLICRSMLEDPFMPYPEGSTERKKIEKQIMHLEKLRKELLI